ncbi:homeodomain-interacting protein kinase 1-like [Plectropomus leopardus]|uniref:homeodomain-interacting protein kinase 1-like n=1 Tax=Plectropomus leopardus TaxID=160734 RepID=UPI001C4CD876|nr:homeodomain-interacting protein kinase 1-like [Plectropomus leopardus]
MMDNQDFEVIEGSLISSTTSDYEVQDLLGSGTYGEVAKCRKVATGEMVALKILKSTSGIEDAKKEAATLEWMKDLNSDKFNIITLNDSFTFKGRYCLEFEKLDINLYQFTEIRPLELNEIRPIVQQLASALDFLKTVGVIHADLKPENIMMVDHVRQPLKVKVIDFGIACQDPEGKTGVILQSLWYRAPELLLGCPFNEAIDVWSLACIAVEMLRGIPLFPGCNEYDMTFENLPDEDADAYQCDRANFVELLKKMLTVDAFDRITPSEILQHPFITMSHLIGEFDSSPYVTSSMEMMTIREIQSSDDGEEATYNSPAFYSEESNFAWLSDVEQPCLHSTVAEENSPAQKRKRGDSDDSECGNKSPNTTKRQRSERLDTAQKVVLTSPLLLKRKRDKAASCSASYGNPPPKCSDITKRRRTDCMYTAETAGQISPLLLKRKSDEAEPAQPLIATYR